MILGEHEAAQFRSEMAIDARRQGSPHRLAVRGLPAFPAKVGDVRADHQILNQEARAALETRAGRRFDLELALLVDHELSARAAASALAPGAGCGSLAFSMPLGLTFALMSGRPGPPFSRAISSRNAATTRRSSAPSSKSRNTKLLSSAGESASRSGGGDIPLSSQKTADSEILDSPHESIGRTYSQAPRQRSPRVLPRLRFAVPWNEADRGKYEVIRQSWPRLSAQASANVKWTAAGLVLCDFARWA